MNEIKNKNVFIRVSENEKNLIERNAKKCGLSVSEYLRQRALGYMPRAVLPEVFFSFNDKLDELCVVCEGKISADTEEKIIALIDSITEELILPKHERLVVWCDMATTGFWPVKSRLKEVIDYAENSDKTIDKKYVDSDLYATLQYAADDNKTDERMYVSGINCNAKRAYGRMMATKKRFGKVGGNVAYHGYQSFQSGEVTPKEAHKIGMETARRMWGNEYEIVVTTHLNTDNVHNHFVVNSVSFKTGRNFENHISDHYKLREISDTVCLEHGKSVLKDATFYGGEKKDYWLKKKGNMTHRELLKSDIDSAIAQSTNFKAFEYRLKDMGYTIQRDMNYAHYSVKAPSWQRAIRLDRLGKEYTPAAIRERLLDNQRYIGYLPFHKPKYAPLILFEIEYRKTKNMDGIQVMFALVIELCRLITGNNIAPQSPRPLSPKMRQEVVKLDKTLKEYKFLCENHIDSPQELVSFITEKRKQIGVLESERQSVYNRNRHKKSEELNAQAREITAKIKPLREELTIAKAVLEKIPKLKELLETERLMENAAIYKNKERGYAR